MMFDRISIKNWAVEDRPREKMQEKGIRALSDAELLAILIRSGSRNESAVELSRRILAQVNNNLNELGKRSIEDLVKFKGMGEAKAINILAALEIGRRRKETDPEKRIQISNSNDVAEIFSPLVGDLHYEEFWVLLLDRSNRLRDRFMVSQGGITGTVIDVRIILKTAIEKRACSMILCHNHPSGNIEPSDADKQITKKLKDAGHLMDIPVLDHVIIGNDAYFSFSDAGII